MDFTTVRIIGTKGINGSGFPAIAIGASGFVDITSAAALLIVPTLGTVIGTIGIGIAGMIAGIIAGMIAGAIAVGIGIRSWR